MKKEEFVIILFYKFVAIEDREALRDEQLQVCEKIGIKGRLLISNEGVNGTFEGTRAQVGKYKAKLKKDKRFSSVVFKESAGNGEAFPKLQVKIRDEIVALGIEGLDPINNTATQLPAEELQKWYENNEDFVLLDLRNDYEIASGHFEGTVDPGLKSFSELPEKLKNIENLKDKKVVSVCTGGIRCELATVYLKEQGFKDLYQLENGIHDYMQKFPASHFKGTLYVFDNRITTPVVDSPDREIVGRCTFCDSPCEQYVNDDSTKPSTKLICCDECFAPRTETFRPIVS